MQMHVLFLNAMAVYHYQQCNRSVVLSGVLKRICIKSAYTLHIIFQVNFKRIIAKGQRTFSFPISIDLSLSLRQTLVLLNLLKVNHALN